VGFLMGGDAVVLVQERLPKGSFAAEVGRLRPPGEGSVTGSTVAGEVVAIWMGGGGLQQVLGWVRLRPGAAAVGAAGCHVVVPVGLALPVERAVKSPRVYLRHSDQPCVVVGGPGG
jgi:hypothetical protein